MIPFVNSVMTYFLAAFSEKRKAAARVSVRSLPRSSDSAPRRIEIDNSQGELPIHDCVIEQLRETEGRFVRVGWKREIPARQTQTVALQNTAGTPRPRGLPQARVTFRQSEWWWRKDSRGRLRRARAPVEPTPRSRE